MQIYDKKKKKKKKKKKRRDLGGERKFPLICPLANEENKANDASVFVGRVFFILIRSLELQRGVSEKGLDLQTDSANALFKRTLQRSTNRLYGPRDVVWVTGLIIDSVRFLTDAQAAQLIKPVRICINIRKRVAMCSGLVRWPYFTHTLRSCALTLCAID